VNIKIIILIFYIVKKYIPVFKRKETIYSTMHVFSSFRKQLQTYKVSLI
jgi:hypothetical protein